jgi:cathepsin L
MPSSFSFQRRREHFILMFALLSLASAALIRDHEERSFVAHMREHGLAYTGDEYHFRFGIYLSQAQWVREFNAADNGFTVELNKFATYTPAESAVLRGYRQSERIPGHEIELKNTVGAPPTDYDWKAKGVVQAIKDQGQCGSCWSFGSIGAQESAWAIKYSKLTSLSEQNLVDCVTSCYGCSGGNVDLAYYYVIQKQKGNFNSEANYPYVARNSACRYNAADALTQISDWGTVSRTESALQQVVYQYGPVAIAIDASKNSFQLYKSGIYNEKSCSSTKLDHAVVVVGYGTSPSDYWLVKNSWGTKWGEAGYIRMTRNVNNQCGVATDAIVPFAK